MSYRASSEFEREVLETFEEKLEDTEEVSDDVSEVIIESLDRTTISHRGDAEKIAEAIMEDRIDATD
jgi:putative component of toxin-antitoxin plasmid stabilization module